MVTKWLKLFYTSSFSALEFIHYICLPYRACEQTHTKILPSEKKVRVIQIQIESYLIEHILQEVQWDDVGLRSLPKLQT